MTKDNTPAPGEARADGPTVTDTLCSDRIPPPPPLLDSRYEFLGDEDIDFRRYTSRTFFDREIDRLWPRAWQWACREEHLQDVGDTHVYDIGPYSVIIVRAAADSIKGYLNSCTHRGTRLLAAEGSGYSPAFTCPFHGWSWHLDGSIRNIPARWDFPHVCSDRHDLQPVRCERWGGFVFINLDRKAPRRWLTTPGISGGRRRWTRTRSWQFCRPTGCAATRSARERQPGISPPGICASASGRRWGLICRR